MHKVLEDSFISDLISSKKSVSVYLKNGICLKGILTGADKYALFLDNGFVQMIYKHRVSTIESSIVNL